MYKGFNLKLDKREIIKVSDEDKYDNWLSKGRLIHNDIKKQINKNISSFKSDDYSLNGSRIQNNWFPQIEKDIFISHSSKDLELAQVLVGFFKKELGLSAFIDESVWGYSNELIRLLDDHYCENKGEDGKPVTPKTYNYQLRNQTTSHVHMMLTVALTQMINRCDCVIFLNTENAVQTKNNIQQTKSPWIYTELEITKMIHEMKTKNLNESKTFSTIDINYDLPIEHLILMTFQDLIDCQNLFEKRDMFDHDINTSIEILYNSISENNLYIDFVKYAKYFKKFKS